MLHGDVANTVTHALNNISKAIDTAVRDGKYATTVTTAVGYCEDSKELITEVLKEKHYSVEWEGSSVRVRWF